MRPSRQGGFSLLALVALVLFAAVAATLSLSVQRSRDAVTALGGAAEQFAAIEKALVAHAAQNRRLPCPASGTAGTGLADPGGASVICNQPAGVVPWATLGLSRDAVTDAWGGLISYRVFDGATGLTQAEGAAQLDCDSVEELPRAVTASGGCQSTQDTLPASWLAGKGLTLNDNGNTISDVAWLLVSHGPTGRGGFSNGLAARPVPSAGGDEARNASAAGPFARLAASSAGVDPASTAHYDDLVSYVRLGDLVVRSGNGARDWADAALEDRLRFSLDAATVSQALGASIATGQNTGQTRLSLNYGQAVLQAVSGSGDATIGIRTSNSTEGIGIGGTSNVAAGSEYFDITFATSNLRKFGITLNEFGSGTLSGTPYQERVRISFYNGNTLVDSVIKFSCAPSNPLASFDITAAADFNTVRVEPLTAEPAVGNSSFLVSAIRACPSTSTSCPTTLATSVPSSVCP